MKGGISLSGLADSNFGDTCRSCKGSFEPRGMKRKSVYTGFVAPPPRSTKTKKTRAPLPTIHHSKPREGEDSDSRTQTGRDCLIPNFAPSPFTRCFLSPLLMRPDHASGCTTTKAKPPLPIIQQQDWEEKTHEFEHDATRLPNSRIDLFTPPPPPPPPLESTPESR